MKKNIARVLLLLLIGVLASGCASPTPAPTVTPLPTDTPVPTDTPLPTSTVPQLILPEAPTGTPDKSGQGGFDLPLTSWNGIPIMKGVITGSGDNNSYRFIINTAANRVSNYYSGVMQSLGWKLVPGSGQGAAVELVYVKGTDTVKISITQQASFTVVVLSKGP